MIWALTLDWEYPSSLAALVKLRRAATCKKVFKLRISTVSPLLFTTPSYQYQFGAINEPIYMTSNYRIPTDGTPVDWSGIHSNIYQRNRNVNQMVLQDKLCALTGAEDGAGKPRGILRHRATIAPIIRNRWISPSLSASRWSSRSVPCVVPSGIWIS